MRQQGSGRALGLVLGVLVDKGVPDPRRGHPVALFGQAAAWVEQRMWADTRARGVAYAAMNVGAATALGLALGRAVRPPSPRAVVAVTAACTWAVVGQASLVREAERMRVVLETGDVPAARQRLPHLCGRDPSSLDEKELTRATVESVAENAADALVAPMLWGAAFGPAGLLGYRAVNTLDAMVGHRGPRYRRFGWAAARLDDAANWLPARVTALLAVGAAPLVNGSVREAWRVLRRDGARHPSPNAGRCEAAAAGALGVRLGGPNHYPYGVDRRPELGGGPAAEPADIARAVRLARVVEVGSVLLAAALPVLGKRLARVAVSPPNPCLLRGVARIAPGMSASMAIPRRECRR